MKVTINHIFIFIIFYAINLSSSTLPSRKYYLNKDDSLNLPIEEFLDYDQNSELLSFETSGEFNVLIDDTAN